MVKPATRRRSPCKTLRTGVRAMLVNVGRFLACAALWTASLAGVSAQQTEPATTENPQIQQELKQIKSDAAEKQRQSNEILRQLPVDPDECVLPVLVDLMEQTKHEKQVRRYVSVFDHDMDGNLQRLLRQRGLEASPN